MRSSLTGGCVEVAESRPSGNCKWTSDLKGGPLAPFPRVHSGWSACGREDGQDVVPRPQRQNGQEAIVEANNGQTVRLQVARQTPSNSYVADASPLGEIFVANTDLSVVIHRPRASGIKVGKTCKRHVKLLGVIWM